MDEYILDFELFSKHFLKILTKDSRLKPFEFNVYQKELWRSIKEKEAAHLPVRIINLKPRQIGTSTFFSAYDYWKVSTNFYKKALIVANDSDATSNIFNMTKRFYDFSPKEIRPMRRYSNRRELVFANPDDATRDENPGLLSEIGVETAGKKQNLGRGSTYGLIHCTEVAFWPDQSASVSMTALMQVCPYIEDTTVVIESTANGMAGDGEYFFNMWNRAESGKSDFTPIFFPYYWNPEYRLPAHNMVFTGYEQHLLDQYKDLTKEALAWRRYKIDNEMGNTASMTAEDAFKQEFCISSQEAFLMSGRPVFDPMRIQSDMDIARNIEFKRGQFV